MFVKPTVAVFGRVLRFGIFATVGLLSMQAGLHAQTVKNDASLTPPTGVTNTGTTCSALQGTPPAPSVTVAFDSASGVCTSSDSDSLGRQADLAIAKTQSINGGAFAATAATLNLGGEIQYRLVISNAGPSEVLATSVATFQDVVPSNFTAVSIVGSPTPGAGATTCTASVSGNTVSGSFSGPKDATCTVTLRGTASTPTATTAAPTTGVDNVATVAAPADVTDPTPANNQGRVTTIITGPQLTLLKTASAARFTVGVAAGYTLQLTNSGTGATTTASTIIDSIPAGLTVGALPAGCTVAGQTVTCTVAAGLAAGASTSFVIPVTPTAAAPATITNTATVSGGGDASCPADERCGSSVTTPVGSPSLELTKTGALSADQKTISYSFSVRNSGNVDLTNVTVSDAKLPSLACPAIATLAAGATQAVTCTGNTYTTTPADFAAGQVLNTATASGTPPTGPVVSDSDDETVTLTAQPSLELIKTGALSVDQKTISYSFSVRNSGNVDLTNVTVSDAKLPSLACPAIATLAAGATQAVTCTGNTYTVQLVDQDAGQVVNTANATGTPQGGGTPVSDDDTVTTPIAQTPKLSSTKVVTSTGPYALNSVISYTITATNTGNISLSNVVVRDTKLTPASITCPALAPNATCVLSGTYTVTQADVDAGSVLNTAAISTDTPGACATAADCAPTVTTPIAQTPKLSSTKVVTSTGPYALNSVISYTITATNTGNISLSNVVVRDTKLSPASVTCQTLAPNATCVLTGTYTVTQADVDAGSVLNTAAITTNTPGACATAADCAPTVTTPIAQAPKLSSTKVVTSTGPYALNSVISYTITATNTGNISLSNVVVRDTKLTPASITCPALAPNATCVLSGTYTVTQADVDAGSVLNTAAISTDTPGACATAADCAPTVTTPIAQAPKLTIDKTADKSTYSVVGEVVQYRYLVSNTGTVAINGLSVGDDKIATVNCPVTTLAPGASTVCTASYTITQADLVAGTVTNIATANGTPTGGTLTPPTDTVTVTAKAHPIVATDDAATTPQNTPVKVTVLGNDTLDGVQADPTKVTITQVSQPTNGTVVINSDGTVTYTPATGFAGTDTFTYQICENQNPSNCATATVIITVLPNKVEAKDDSGTTDPNTPVTTPVTGNDTTTGNPLDPGSVTVVTPPANGSVVTNPDGSVTYTPNPNYSGTDTYVYQVCDTSKPTATCATATVTITVLPNRIDAFDDAATTQVDTPVTIPVTGNDTTTKLPLDPATVTVQTPPANGSVACTAGSCVYTPNRGYTGTDSFIYRVCDVSMPTPLCDTATVNLTVEGDTRVRVTKQANPRNVKVGDLVRYTVTLENVGDADVVDGTLVDTPPAGFTLVEGSLQVADRDAAGRQAGSHPIRVDQIDIAVGGRATVSYLLRVGAGVRAGIHTNAAEMHDDGRRISNVGTATVQLVADPMTDESTLLGTVFDDRDGDGWQDSAGMTGVRVQGGFAAAAYVANSTTVDRGNGPQPEADASSPLLHGIAIGSIAGRQSDADPAAAREVVVSQLLRSPDFTGDFVLTNAQGATLRMDAAGNTQVVAGNGDAAKGLSAAVPSVERRISQAEGGYRVDYVIRNEGVDERGIPGVRIASVEGLLVETDQYGRYNLIGIDGGRDDRGRNFILKVDPATLPPGSTFTTDNPLVRRITPGLPVRFDFGVKLPPGLVKGEATQKVEMELGEVMFSPGSAEVRSQYQPAIDRMAEQVRSHDGGEVVIAAHGEDELLAFDRAVAVRKALVAALPADVATRTQVSLRTNPVDEHSTVVGLLSWPVLGNVLFDTDAATIKPQYTALLRRIGEYLVEMDSRIVKITGHADLRASDAYNDALGMRRAKAVYDAITAQMPDAARRNVRVEIVPGGRDARSERAAKEAKP